MNTKPPLGLIPKKHYERQIKNERFIEVCKAIKRYYDAGLKINIEWIEEYNELIEGFNNTDEIPVTQIKPERYCGCDTPSLSMQNSSIIGQYCSNCCGILTLNQVKDIIKKTFTNV